MPFDDPVQPLQDILDNTDRIERFLEGKGLVDVAGDERTLFACQYALLIIRETAKRLGGRAEALCRGLPWRDIRGIGNHLRHAYDSLDAHLIWRVHLDERSCDRYVERRFARALSSAPAPSSFEVEFV